MQRIRSGPTITLSLVVYRHSSSMALLEYLTERVKRGLQTNLE
uniref:Uncharacterized protein n=1 Tax=Parascaris equorum TaxID=6256 RepID=A0A914RXI9_PAREQ